VRVELKGINRTKKRLKDGTVVIYYYAWKGGPRLTGERGSPEFVASYYDAWKTRIALENADHLFKGLARDYMASRYFTKKLKPRVQKLNGQIIGAIVQEFGELDLKVFDLPDIEIDIEDWRDELHDRSPSTASRWFSQLSAVLNWGVKRGRLKRNPCKLIEGRYFGSRADFIWKDVHEAQFLARGPAHFHLALILAIWTGQREADLVALRWSQYDGEYLCIEQQKGRLGRPRRKVTIYVGTVLKEWLDRVKLERGIKPEDEADPFVLLTTRGEPWAHANSFASKFSVATDEAGIDGLTFHDLRGTAVTRLFRAGCSVPQIATITGHSLKTVQTILDKHYFHRDAQMSKDAIQRREEYEGLPTRLPTEQSGPAFVSEIVL
jgi:integrase